MATTATAPTNIAVLKYWGKNPAFEELMIPTKSSLSFTVDGLFTKTTVEAKKRAGGATKPGISFMLNGKKHAPADREHRYVADFVAKVGMHHPAIDGYDYRIESENNFPTAAGYASSASGFAALIKAMSGEVPELSAIREDDQKLSALARLGSGSATRSIPSRGGFVVWERGVGYPPASSDTPKKAMERSVARTLFPPEHWPELSIIYAKVRAEEKKVKSRAGMKASVETNPIYNAWVDFEEKKMRPEMEAAVSKKDFPALAEKIMMASNNLHQICLGTYPPIAYLNETSFRIIEAAHEMNAGTLKAAYTFDAGPNAVLFSLKKDESRLVSALSSIVGRESLHISRMGAGAAFSQDHLF
ncbi:MAG: diphosphomevalonate decarboxylase [Candidatus Micrarchaeota archaeon]